MAHLAESACLGEIDETNRTFWRSSALFGTVFVLFATWMLTKLGGTAVTNNVDDFGIALAALIAAACCARRASRSSERTAIAWGFLAASATSWAIGEFIYSVLALGSRAVPTPSAADIGYLGAVPFALIGILCLMGPGLDRNSAFRALLDGVVVAGSLLIISWTTTLGVAYTQASESGLGRIVNLAYPITDIAVATVAVSLLATAGSGRRSIILLVIASELCFAIGDSAYAYVTEKNLFAYPDLLDATYFAAFILLALASLRRSSTEDSVRTSNQQTSRLLVVLPFAVLPIALIAEIVSGIRSHRLHPLLVVAGATVLVAVIFRQVLVILRNLQLANNLQSANDRLREREERLLHYALHDPLTGLANRLVLDDRIGEALVRGRDRATPLAVLLCDLDHFKRINDTLGHSVGDVVLRSVAVRMRNCVRPEDIIVRTGGDEFAILIDDRSRSVDVEVMAAAIVDEISAPLAVNDSELVVHVSVGISRGQLGASSAETLLRDADVALYAAKNAGGNTYRLFDDHISRSFFERLELQSELTMADPSEFEVVYQPIVDLRAQSVVGVEALVRWNHPTRGLLSPGSFIALAEESGMIVSMGHKVLRDALSQIKAWRGELPGADQLWVAVNVSARQLLADDLNRLVRDGLAATRNDADALHIELTESALMDQSASSLELFQATRDLGVSLGIDDFGTGYSSLAYLDRMPIDTLKIDADFTARLDQEENATRIIEAVLSLAHALGLEVTAEGVETVAQLDRLTELGAEFAQGYVFCEPLPPDRFAEWWRSSHQYFSTSVYTKWPQSPKERLIRERH